MRHILTFLLAIVSGVICLHAQSGIRILPPFSNPDTREQYPEVRFVNWVAPSDAVRLPASVDNSLSDAFPPVFSQIGGSCAQASTIGYMFTYEVNTLLGRKADVPENRFSYLYSWNFINGGKDEGSLSWDGIALALKCGMMTEADFPVQTSAYSFRWASGYDRYFRALHYRVDSFEYINADTHEGVETLKRYLYDGGVEGGKGKVVVFSSASEGWSMDDYYDGPSLTGYGSILLGLPRDGAHAMTIVGYDDTVECTAGGRTTYGAFIVVNSWGAYFHDRGRYYLPYRFFEEEQAPEYILSKEVVGIDVKYVEPVLTFGVGLTYSSRDDLSFSVGAAPKAYSEAPEIVSGIDIARHQGGDYPMQGSGFPDDIEFCFDLSPIADKALGMDDVSYFLGITKNARGSVNGGGHIDYLKLYDYRDGSGTPTVYVAELPEERSIKNGQNWFALRTAELQTTSASPVAWLGTDGTPVSGSFIVKTADGGYAKLKFSDYDREKGTIKLRYVYASDSNLGN